MMHDGYAVVLASPATGLFSRYAKHAYKANKAKQHGITI